MAQVVHEFLLDFTVHLQRRRNYEQDAAIKTELDDFVKIWKIFLRGIALI